MLRYYPKLKRQIESSSNSLETAIRLAIAGNVIDFGVTTEIDQSVVYGAIKSAMANQLFGDMSALCDAIYSAKKILYLGDNAGEIVFDRLLIEQLPIDRVTFVVRGSPVINDVTVDDARITGMTDFVHVIDNGSDAPGTILKECSDTFRQQFDGSDLVIAKGQGNYETLSDVEKNIFFIFKAKCPVIAGNVGCELGKFVIVKNIKWSNTV